MGQKVNPIGLRMGFIKPWGAKWFAEKDYGNLLIEDINIKKLVKAKLYHAGVSHINISRAAAKCTVDIFTARPGIVIGKRGAGIDVIKDQLQKMTSKEVAVNIREVRKAELDPQLVAENVAMQLERRVAFRRVMKRAVQSAIKLGAKGIKVRVAGRLGGAEIARAEWYMEGSVPLHTLRADIGYGVAEAKTTYGKIGIKVWVHRGLVFQNKDKENYENYSVDQQGSGS